MIPSSFDYHAPATLAEAVALLGKYPEDAKVLSGGQSLRALSAHVTSYTLAFTPAIVWVADDLSPAGVVGTVAAIFIPHFIQDDGRLLDLYLRRVKRSG